MRMPTNKWKDEPLTKEMIEELHKKLKKQREKEDKNKKSEWVRNLIGYILTIKMWEGCDDLILTPIKTNKNGSE